LENNFEKKNSINYNLSTRKYLDPIISEKKLSENLSSGKKENILFKISKKEIIKPSKFSNSHKNKKKISTKNHLILDLNLKYANSCEFEKPSSSNIYNSNKTGDSKISHYISDKQKKFRSSKENINFSSNNKKYSKNYSLENNFNNDNYIESYNNNNLNNLNKNNFNKNNNNNNNLKESLKKAASNKNHKKINIEKAIVINSINTSFYSSISSNSSFNNNYNYNQNDDKENENLITFFNEINEKLQTQENSISMDHQSREKELDLLRTPFFAKSLFYSSNKDFRSSFILNNSISVSNDESEFELYSKKNFTNIACKNKINKKVEVCKKDSIFQVIKYAFDCANDKACKN
jgi:hypothetical protein